MAVNPQIRLRLEPKVVKTYELLAQESGQDLSEYINDRLKLVIDDEDATISRIAEAFLTIWRIYEVMRGRTIGMNDEALPNALMFVCQTLSNATIEPKSKTAEADVVRLRQHIDKLRMLKSNEIYFLGKEMTDPKSGTAA